MSCSKCLRLGLVTVSLAWTLASAAFAERVTYARYPALAPDGKTLAFCWAGDIWTVPSSGGVATRLSVHPATDSHPVWSRDGEQIGFGSTRHGARNVFRMSRNGENVTRVTFSDRSETPTDWSADGTRIYYHARKQGELEWEPRMYWAPADVGQSWLVMRAFGHNGKISPDGKHLVFTRGASRWWRTGYRGSANWDVWLHHFDTGAFVQLTDFDGTDTLPVWNADGSGVYFLSDRAGVHNVWLQPADGAPARQITHATGERVRDFTVSANDEVLIYTQWDRVFRMELPEGEPREIEITAAADSADNGVELKTFTNAASEAAVSPDGEEIALVVRGEIFVIKTEDDKPTRRVTSSHDRDWYVTWSPDGKALFFVCDREGQEDIYRAVSAEDPPKPLSDSLRFTIERVTDDPAADLDPSISPDGKTLAFRRGRGDVVLRDLERGDERLILESWNQPSFRWSPDSKWLALEVEDAEYNSDIWVVTADGESEPVNISKHPDSDINPRWSADGQVLAFSSLRHGFDYELYRVFLSPELDQMARPALDDYFKNASEKAGKRKPLEDAVASGKIALAGAEAGTTQPATAGEAADGEEAEGADKPSTTLSIESQLRGLLKRLLEEPKDKKDDKKDEKTDEKVYEYELETAWRRVQRVISLPADQANFALTPGGDALLFSSRHTGKTALYRVEWDGDELKSLVSGSTFGLHFALDGKRVFYVKSGVPSSNKAGGGDAKTHKFRGKMALEHRLLATQKFNDAARYLGEWFYHPTLKGLDWPALTAKHRDLALTTRTWSEFNEIFDLLQGRLNGSHLGIFGPGGRSVESVGYLGCAFDPDYEGPGLRVASITPKAPADREESKLYVGDVLLSINGQEVGRAAPFERALIDTVGDEVILSYLPSPDRPTEEDTEAAGEEHEADSQPAQSSQPAQPEPAELVIRPISYGAWNRLKYDEWVETNRRYVDQKSNGRVAYAHISGMGEPQFYTFERDLYAAAHGKDGLIIDVRNNGGGWTADWVMAVLNVKRHAYTIGRGGEPGYPQGRLIFYAWTKPATMMCNQFSYSNAEIISHAFQNTHRGPLVGMTTWGAVISTGSYGLIDGTRIRMPFRGWYTLPNRLDMENHGAEPDIKMPRTPADEQAGRFPQLDAAIQATLDQLEAETETARAAAQQP